MQRLSIPSGLMFILTIVSRISFQRSGNGFRNLSEKQWQMMFFDFQGQKSCLGAEFEGPASLLRKPEVFLDSHARREHFKYLWVHNGLRMTKL